MKTALMVGGAVLLYVVLSRKDRPGVLAGAGDAVGDLGSSVASGFQSIGGWFVRPGAQTGMTRPNAFNAAAALGQAGTGVAEIGVADMFGQNTFGSFF